MNGSLWRGLAMSAAMTLAGGLLTMAPANAAEGVTINLVVTNDFHGQIDDDVVQWAATVEQLLGDSPADNSLLVSAGDMIGASTPASAAQQDDPTIDVLNLLGLDAYAVGNHEFDAGYDTLVNHVMERADFPVLGANVTKSDGSAALRASATFTVGGARVAVIGAVTQSTPTHAPGTIAEGLNFGEPVAAINSEVDRLNALPEAEQPDVIVAAIHDGAPWGTWNLEQAKEASSMFKRLVEDTSPDVNAIVTGHTHNTYVFNAPVPGAADRTRPVIQTGSGGDNVGQIKLTLNTETGEVSTTSARNVSRVSTPDAELIASNPTLAEIAEVRDAAVEYVDAHNAAAIAAQQAYETATGEAHVAYAAAVEARDELQQSVTAAEEAHNSAISVKELFDATVAAGKEAYTTAADLKQQHITATATGKQAYETAADLKQQHTTASAAGKEAYTTAADLKQRHDAAAATGKEAYATAGDLKQQHTTATATGKQAYETAADLRQQYDTAVATGQQAYESAAALRDEYARLAASVPGETNVPEVPEEPEVPPMPEVPEVPDTETEPVTEPVTEPETEEPDVTAQLAALVEQFQAAITAGEEAYTEATALVPRYQEAVAAGKDANAQAAALVAPYQEAIAAGKDAYAQAATLVAPYQEAIATGKDAYAEASRLATKYQEAIATGKDAYAEASRLATKYQEAIATGTSAYTEAATIKDEYDSAMSLWRSALATADELKTVLEAAMSTWDSAEAALSAAKDKLLDLL